MKNHITILGGGIIGLFSAYFLRQEGFDVTILDQGDGQEGCSHGNAGMVVPSHFIPLAAPGMIEKGLKWMFDRESPFYVKPRLSLDLIRWGWAFYQAANTKHVDRAVPALRDLGLFSRQLYHDLAETLPFSFSYEEKGLLMICQKESTWDEEVEVAHRAQGLGMEARILSAQELQALEPKVDIRSVGGVLYPGDAHLSPSQLVAGLQAWLTESGVVFQYQTRVVDWEKTGGRISQLWVEQAGNRKAVPVDRILLAGGAWSGKIAKQLGGYLPMQSGKGYSFTQPQPGEQTIQIPSILLEARVAVTPFGAESIRFGGTMEVGEVNGRIDAHRVQGIWKAIETYYPAYRIPKPALDQVWYGLRPCAPDGMPYMGAFPGLSNLWVASGHAMMGLSLAPATGKIMADVLSGRSPHVSLDMYYPGRFA